MQIGLFLTMDHYPDQAVKPAEHLHHITHLVEVAEELGFHEVWFTEQHFNPMDGICTNPGMMMSYVAARTQRIRLGAAVVLPGLVDNPVQLAESYTLLDNLSKGRIDVGLGKGSMRNVYAGFGADFAKRQEACDRAVDSLASLWGGQHPRLAPQLPLPQVSLTLTPQQYPHPPIWVATGDLARATNVLACGHSVLHDFMFSHFALDDLLPIRQTLNAAFAPAIPRIGSVLYAYPSASMKVYSYFARFFEDFARSLHGPEFDLRHQWDELQENGQILCCSPETARERVDHLSALGVDQVLLGVGFGGAPFEEIEQTLYAFAPLIATPARL